MKEMVSEKNYIENLQWNNAIPDRSIAANEVHVWRVFVKTIPYQITNFQEILSTDELERAGKFYFEKDQKRFMITRGILRMILSNYIGEKPEHIHFKYSALGKPILEINPGQGNICFNLSHSNEIALYAVTLNRDTGIDVEYMRNNIEVEQLVNRFFSIGENNLFNAVKQQDRSTMFFKIWTRKEAITKAIGKGISFPIEKVDVSLIKDNVLSKVELTDENKESHSLSVLDLSPEKGYSAAIAVSGHDCKIICRHLCL